MIQPRKTIVFWGGRLSDDELDSLEKIIGTPLSMECREELNGVYFDYVSRCAITDQAPSVRDLRDRLKQVADRARQAAELLGAEDYFFDGRTGLHRPKNLLPRDSMAQEVNSRLQDELWKRDLHCKNEYGIDPLTREIELLDLSWQLAQVSVAASAARSAIAPQKSGRRKSGAETLVTEFVRVLGSNQVKVTCYWSDADGAYLGLFPRISTWLCSLPQPVRERAVTLNKMAADFLSSAKKDEIGGKKAE